MAYDKFLIAPIQNGMQSNVKPWLIMDDAFERLRNMYVWRGRITKRFGSRVMKQDVSSVNQQLFSRFRFFLGTTNSSGNFSTTVDGTIFKIGQMFSCGNNIYTVVEEGTPGQLLVYGIGTADYNTVNGGFVLFNSDPNTDVFFYPAQPVMGLTNYLKANADSLLVGFDTQFAYSFDSSTGWENFDAGPVFTGNNLNFFWSTNYRASLANTLSLFTTNNNVPDGFWYYDGTNWTQLGSYATSPIITSGTPSDRIYLETALIFEPFNNRLVAFNVSENVGGVSTRFINRIRYSQAGSPVETDSWLENVPGKGGFLDIPVSQPITSVGFVKDRLIIYMELSTWELVYTGNDQAPFIVQQINSELGVESTNSTVPFDKVLLGFGNSGIHECSSINVDRIDDIIPKFIFDVAGNQGSFSRTYGIRDYYTEQVYWSFNSNEQQSQYSFTYPNRVLIYDYVNKTWAYNDDSITCFGYYKTQFTLTWAGIDESWESIEATWADPENKSNFRAVIGGNQQGFTFFIDNELTVNAPVFSITNIEVEDLLITITALNHNLRDSDFVRFSNIQDSVGDLATALNGNTFQINILDGDNFSVFVNQSPTGVYEGAGTYEWISYPEVLTKQYNFYNKIGQNIALARVDFLVDRTANGRFSVDFIPSTTNVSMYNEAVASDAAFGTNIVETSPYALYPLEATQDRFWHSIYFNVSGENIQLKMYLDDTAMEDNDANSCDIEINAFMFYVTKSNYIFGG